MLRLLLRSLATLLLMSCNIGVCSGFPSADVLIRKLATGSEQDRVEARQLLPRTGVETVAKILPFLDDEDQEVWRTTYNVLADIANEVSVPGREKDRIQVTSYLMTLVGPDRSDRAKELGLRLLPLVIPPGFDVSPVAALLDDVDWREKARQSLEQTGTREAMGALRECLASSKDTEFRVALIRSLAHLKDYGAREILTTLLSDDSPNVRAAAARALAPMSDATQVPAFQTVYRRSTPETEFETTEALLFLADSIIAKGKYRDIALRLCRDVLHSSTITPLVGAAMIRLGRFGDASVIPELLERAEANGDLEAALYASLLSLEGEDVDPALHKAYTSCSDDMKPCLLRVFGARGCSECLDILKKESSSSNEEIQLAAVDGLGESCLPGALDALKAAATSPATTVRHAAVESLQQMSEKASQKGAEDLAGRSYLALFELSTDKDKKILALEGLSRYPVPEAVEPVLKSLQDPEQASAAAEVLASLSDKLVREGKLEEAARILPRFAGSVRSTDLTRRVIQIARRLGGDLNDPSLVGFIGKWMVIGPFPWSAQNGFRETHVNEPDIDLKAPLRVEGREIRWTTQEVRDIEGVVNLAQRIGDEANVCAYGYAEIEVPQETRAVLRIGTDDGVKVWVNKQAVHENNTGRASDLDQDLVPVTLKKGVNSILLEVTQGTGGWDFRVRITRKDGTVLPFQQILP